jgi:hypothetical protein
MPLRLKVEKFGLISDDNVLRIRFDLGGAGVVVAASGKPATWAPGWLLAGALSAERGADGNVPADLPRKDADPNITPNELVKVHEYLLKLAPIGGLQKLEFLVGWSKDSNATTFTLGIATDAKEKSEVHLGGD